MSPSELSDDALLALISKGQASTKKTKISTDHVFARVEKCHELFSELPTKPDCSALVYRDPVSRKVTWKGIGERLLVGRSTTVDEDQKSFQLQIDDDEMSRQHFEIVRQGDSIYAISDLASTNGLFLNEVEEKTGLLVSGTEIRAGQTSFVFVRA